MKRFFVNGRHYTPEEFDELMGKGSSEKYLELFRFRLRNLGHAYRPVKGKDGKPLVVYVEDTDVLESIY